MGQKFNSGAVSNSSSPIKKKRKFVKTTPVSPYSELPGNMKTHCEKFEYTPSTDPLAVPVPKMFFRPGGVNLMLCKDCTSAGRLLEPKKLGQRHGIIIPMCADCSRANHRISQIVYFSGVIKSIVDDAQVTGKEDDEDADVSDNQDSD